LLRVRSSEISMQEEINPKSKKRSKYFMRVCATIVMPKLIK
jgi:hypothetical protein